MAKVTPGLRAMLKEGVGIVGAPQTAQRANTAQQAGRGERAAAGGVMASSQQGLRRTAAAARRDQSRVRTEIAQTTNRYGAALGQSIAQSFAPAGATATAGVMKSKAGVQAGKENKQTLAGMMGIYGRGFGAVANAARRAINTAMAGQGLAGQAEVIALAGGILTDVMDMQKQMALMDYQYKLQEKAAAAEGPDAQAVSNFVTTQGENIISFAASTDADAYQLPDGGFDINGAVEAYANQNGIPTDGTATPAEQMALMTLRQTFGSMNGRGVSASEAFNSALQTNFGGYKWWSKVSPSISNYTTTWEETETTAYNVAAGQASTDTQGFGRTAYSAKALGMSEEEARQVLVKSGATGSQIDQALSLGGY